MTKSARHKEKPARAEPKAPPLDSEKKPLKVRICQAIEREVSDYENLNAWIEPMQVVQIRARVSGYVVSVYDRPGRIVQQGDTLFQIDPRSYRLELDKAEAEVRRAQSRLEPLSIQLEEARTTSQRQRATPKQQQRATAKFVADLEEAEASLQAARADRDLAQLGLDYAKVTAPFTGKVGGPRVSPGDVVVADKTVLATVTKIDPLSVGFNVSEATFLRINRLKREGKLKFGVEPDLLVQVGLGDEPGFRLTGKVYSVANQVDSGTNGVQCAASIPNADGLLLPGMSARVHLETSVPRRSVLVPSSALMYPDVFYAPGEQPLPSVVVVTDRNARELRSVKIGLAHGESQVVTEGVKAGEWIVIDRDQLRHLSGRGAAIEFDKVPWPATGSTSEAEGSTR